MNVLVAYATWHGSVILGSAAHLTRRLTSANDPVEPS